MKFPKLHHERILDIIRSNGFELENFFLVKRKGWIRIEYQLEERYFSYFKVKETRIDPDTKQWVNDFYFKVRTEDTSKTSQVPSFNDLMKLFETWIREID